MPSLQPLRNLYQSYMAPVLHCATPAAKDVAKASTEMFTPTKDLLDIPTQNISKKLLKEVKITTRRDATPQQNAALANQKKLERKTIAAVEAAAKDMASSFDRTLTKVTNFFKKVIDKVTAPFRWVGRQIKKLFGKNEPVSEKASKGTQTTEQESSATKPAVTGKSDAPSQPKN
jgi:hypothetical protein